jgi:hypothetical protein
MTSVLRSPRSTMSQSGTQWTAHVSTLRGCQTGGMLANRIAAERRGVVAAWPSFQARSAVRLPPTSQSGRSGDRSSRWALLAIHGRADANIPLLRRARSTEPRHGQRDLSYALDQMVG